MPELQQQDPPYRAAVPPPGAPKPDEAAALPEEETAETELYGVSWEFVQEVADGLAAEAEAEAGAAERATDESEAADGEAGGEAGGGAGGGATPEPPADPAPAEPGYLERVRDLHAADLADLIEGLKPDHRIQLLYRLGDDLDPEILAYLDDDVREAIMEELGPETMGRLLGALDTDDAIDLVVDLDADEQQEYLRSVPEEDRRLIEEGLAYPEYSAGRMMQREFVAIPHDWTVGETIDYLRSRDDLPDDFFNLFVVGAAGDPEGTMPLSRVIRSRRPTRVSSLMDEEFRSIPVAMDQEEVALMFRQYGLVETAVVDETGKLVGTITVDDVVDVIDEEAEEDILRLAGVQESDIYRAVLETTKSRFTWLLVNLGTAILASGVIAVFESTIERIVALAVLMPIVASMGGNAGTQTLTVAVRALAMKELEGGNAWRVIGKEVAVGLINGLAFAVITGGLAFAWFGDPSIGMIIAVAMVINLLIAGLSGAGIPILLQRLGLDPAVSSAVFLTTVTDIVGFFAFLGLAAMFLL